MDPVTHTLAGIAVANAFLKRKLGPASVPLLAAASNLPDVDVLVHLSGDPAAITLRRSFGHSLLTVPFWCLALAALSRKRYPELGLKESFGLCLLGVLGHLFLDLVNSFGVGLLWPLSPARPELAVVFIIDLLLTGLLAAPLVLERLGPLRGRLEGLSRLALAGAALYVLFCSAGRLLARRLVSAEARTADFSYVFPEPLGPHRWRAVVRRGGLYRLYLVRPFAGEVEPKGEVRTQGDDPRVRRLLREPLPERLSRFFKAPVWRVEEPRIPGGPAEAVVYDLRFRPLVVPRGAAFRFRFGLPPDVPRGRSAGGPSGSSAIIDAAGL